MATFIQSQRGARKLVYEGFAYTLHRSDENKSSWRCERRVCNGRAISQGENVIVQKCHGYPPNPQAIESAIVSNRVKEKAVTSHNVPRDVVSECLEGVSDAAIAIVPQIVSLERKVNRKRRHQADGDRAPIPHNLADIRIPEDLRTTRTMIKEDFLLVDTGVEDESRIIIFGTVTDRARLAKCTTWLADGTFKVAPEMFTQVWVLHGLYQNRVLPFIYCLLPDKREVSYTRAINLITASIDENEATILRPDTIIIDFEKAEEKSFRSCIPNATVHGCFFHFAQSIWRKIQTLGMQVRYGVDVLYNGMLRKFIALSFCAEADVPDRYNLLAEELISVYGNTEVHQDFLQYFENTWVGRPHRTPRFRIQMWNCKEITELLLPRTNNSVESWHNAFQAAFGCHHPNVYKFLHAILREHVRVNALYVKLQAGEQVPLYARREYENANQRLLALITQYDQRTPHEFLAACSHYVIH